MPTNRRSLKVTERYRDRLIALSTDAQAEARRLWKTLDWDDLAGSYAPIGDRLADTIERAQREAVTLTSAYMGAYLTSELDTPVAPPAIAPNGYVGKSFLGEELRPALDKPLIATLVAIREGKPEPLALGLSALVANVDLDVMGAGRDALIDAVAADDRCSGFKRAVKGTCPACVAKAGADGKVRFPVHPHCRCVGEPSVVSLPDNFKRRDSEETFEAMSFEEQNDAYGFDVAQLIRDHRVDLDDMAAVDANGRFMETQALKNLKPGPLVLSYVDRMKEVTKGLLAKKPKQPTKSLEKLFEKAPSEKQAYEDFLDAGSALQKRLGADALDAADVQDFEQAAARLSAAERPQIVIAPVKEIDAAREKLARKSVSSGQPYDPDNLTDIVRGSIIVKDIEDVPVAFAQLRRYADEKGWKLAEVDDKFGPGGGPLGYRDLQVQLVSPDGFVSEVQIHVDALWRAKFSGGGHDLYEKIRALQVKKGELEAEGRTLDNFDQRALLGLQLQSRKLYDRAFFSSDKGAVGVRQRVIQDEVYKPSPVSPDFEGIRDALDDIDKVNRFPAQTGESMLQSIGIDGGRAEARFDPIPGHVLVDPYFERAERNLIHELGHKLDWELAGDSPELATRLPLTDDLQKLWNVIEDSEGFKTLGRQWQLMENLSYWNSRTEVFARAYAQYVLHKLRKVPRDSDWRTRVEMGIQWKAKDFKKIEKAFDEFLDKQGLLRATQEEITEVSATDFHAAIAKAIKKGPHGKFLSEYSISDYSKMRTFLAEDGKVGGALKPTPDGHWEMVSLFNNGGSKGAGMRMFRYQVSQGGDRLDCIGDKLRQLYEREGFTVRETIKWDDQFAPKGWDYATQGRPNIYVMEKGPPAPRPASEVFKPEVGKVGPKTQETVNEALTLIERTHDFPANSAVTAVEQTERRPHVNGDFEVTPERNVIKLNPRLEEVDPPERLPSVLHEAGHKFDWDLGETLREEAVYSFASGMTEDDENTEALIEAIHSSEAFQRLSLSWTEEQKFFSDPRELFARAYSQYVMVRNDLQDLISEEDVQAGLQWTSADFFAIAEAMDSIMRGRGLLGSRAIRRFRARAST